MAQTSSCRETVLIVEDEGLVRLDAAESLKDAGFAVLEATDASEAMEIVLSREDIDVLFTDINMPGSMDGLELARRVHDCRPEMRLVLTSGAIRPSRDQIPHYGAFLSKPYSPEAMTRAMLVPLALRLKPAPWSFAERFLEDDVYGSKPSKAFAPTTRGWRVTPWALSLGSCWD